MTLRHGYLYGAHQMLGGEGRRDPFTVMVQRMPRAPRVVFYDMGCALQGYAIAREPAYAHENAGPGAYTFSVLGNDAPLFTLPVPEPSPESTAEAPNVPAPILRRVLARSIDTYYGPDKSFAI